MKDIIKVNGPPVLTGVALAYNITLFEGGWFDITVLIIVSTFFGFCVAMCITTWDLIRDGRRMKERFEAVDREVENEMKRYRRDIGSDRH